MFFERIPLDYLRQAAGYNSALGTGEVADKIGSKIDTAYLEGVLNTRDTNGTLKYINWTNRYGDAVTAQRTRGLKVKVMLVGTEKKTPDYGGSMNYVSRELGICTNGGINNPCVNGGSGVYTWGKAYNDIDPRGANVSNETTFGLFKIELVVDDQYKDSENNGPIYDPSESRFVPENELNTGSQLSTYDTSLRPVDRPDYTSSVMEVGDILSIAFPVRAAEENLPQVYKNLDDSTTTATNADGTPNTTGAKPAYLRVWRVLLLQLPPALRTRRCAAGNFFTNPGVGNPASALEPHLGHQPRAHRERDDGYGLAAARVGVHHRQAQARGHLRHVQPCLHVRSRHRIKRAALLRRLHPRERHEHDGLDGQ